MAAAPSAKAQSLSRKAMRMGFEGAIAREAGLNGSTVEFHLPDSPPKTVARRMASAVVLEEDGSLREATLRFPEAPDVYFDRDTVRGAAEAAKEGSSFPKSVVVRRNPVIEAEYAYHFDIAQDDIQGWTGEQFLSASETAAKIFNEQLRGAF